MSKDITEAIASRCTYGGFFRLSNGKTSKYYFDIRQFAMTHRGQILIAESTIDLLSYKTLAINSAGGMETGAIPITMSLVNNWNIDGFFVRKQPKDYGLQHEIEGLVHGKVLIVDDVISTGNGVMKVIETLKDADIVGVLCVLTRDSLGGADRIRETGIPLYTMTTEKKVLKVYNRTE